MIFAVSASALSRAGVATAAVLWLAASAPAQAQSNTPTQAETSPSTNQIQIAYLPSDSPKLKPLEAMLKDHNVLEEMQSSLSFVQLPRPLLLRFAQCNDENAWYDPVEYTVTFCYEQVRHIQNIAPKRAQNGIERQDVIMGSVAFTFLHEVGHALIHMLELPVLGRQEDAADMLAAHMLLKLDAPLPRRFVGGAAWMWGAEARREKPDRGDLADVHSLSSQRFFNLLCMAYGSDPTTFSMVTRYLPSERMRTCWSEFKLTEFAIKKLLEGHIDHDALEAMRQQLLRSITLKRQRMKSPGSAASGDTRKAQ
jgi:hypothetical protein